MAPALQILAGRAGSKSIIDFVFASPTLYSRGFDVSIDDHRSWSKMSDHMPVVCSFG